MLSVYFYLLPLVVSKMCCRACENKLLRDSKINVSRKVRGGRNLIHVISPVWLSMTPWTAAHQVSLSFLFPRICSTSGPSSRWCHPTVSSSVAHSSCSVFPSIRVFSSESALCVRWPKYWSFSFNISTSNEYSGLTGLISLFSKGLSRVFFNTTIFQCSAFFIFSHPYMSTRKTIALTIWTFVGKVMSLLFNTLSRFLTDFLPRSRHDQSRVE